jgi:ElaB/YqjD/DUF883 family membrane-anchored ribosome-binding protein
MSDPKITQDKLSAAGADISSTVNEVLGEARPVLHRLADRVTDSAQELANKGKEAAQEAKEQLESGVQHVRESTENYIHDSPLRSILIAAGTGAAMAMAVTWFLNSNKR